MKQQGGNILVRRATPTDAFEIHRAHLRSIREVCVKDYTEAEITAWGNKTFSQEKRVQSILNDGIWVVENYGTILGFGHIILELNINSAHICALFLVPESLRIGMGKRLLYLMEDYARKNGAKRITLSSSITALVFFKEHGFIEKGEQLKEK